MAAQGILRPGPRGGGLTAALFALLALSDPARADQTGYARLAGHGGPIKGVAISEDGTRALTASFDYTVGLWDVKTGTLQHWFEGHEAASNAVAFLPDGTRAISAGDDFDAIVWDLSTGAILQRLEGHRGKLLSVGVNQPGTMAVTSGWDGRVGLWDLTEFDHVQWLEGHRGNVNDALFSIDGRRVFTASSDGTIRVWDVATGLPEHTLVKHGFGINRLVLNEAAGWLAYGAVDGAVRVIELGTEAVLADLTADRRPILAMAANREGTSLAVGDGEGYIMVLDAVQWTIERDFHAAARGPIWALAWSSDGARVLSGGLDDAAVFWPVSGADPLDGKLASAERSFLRDPDEMTNGERQFARKCSICHTLTPDGARRAGPTLWGLFGRPAGTLTGYRYSDALTDTSIVWEADTIDRLFADGPDHFTPGSKMPMQQIAKPQDRHDLIEYLSENTGPRSGTKPKANP